MSDLKLWILRPLDAIVDTHDEAINPWYPWYDKAFGFVVSAENETQARQIAADNNADEGGDAWLNAGQSICVVLQAGDKPEMIMCDMHSA